MEEINTLRKKIDILDEELLSTLSKRYTIVKKIGKTKKELGVTPLDKKRWKKVLTSRTRMGEKYNLPKKLIVSLYEAIHQYSLEIEEKEQ